MVPSIIQAVRLFLIIISILLFSAPVFASSPQQVRVAIMQDEESVSLRLKGLFRIVDAKDDTLLYKGEDLESTVIASEAGIVLAGRLFRTDTIIIQVAEAQAVTINGRRFRGGVSFTRKNRNCLLVVNRIALEDYINGILYHEASHYWPMEALKAQAIVCRSYALYQMQENAAADFDVTSDIYSQVYGGMTSERTRTNEAVEATKRQVLIYQGKVIPAYYHATCAGHTEDASKLWNIDLPPLKGVVCNFCKSSPHYQWHYVLSKQEVQEKLSKAGYKLGRINSIEGIGRNKSGRLSLIRINTDKATQDISAKDFRNCLGPNIIRSTNFNVTVVNDDIVFEGIGWGHGVGLCQWGAYFMAKDGASYQEILRYYYPGAEIALMRQE